GSANGNTDGCQGETYAGRCDGNTAIWCENGAVSSFDCGNMGQTCGFSDTNKYYMCLDASDGCPRETYEARCDGNTLIYCESNQVKSIACEKQCAYDPTFGAYNCV